MAEYYINYQNEPFFYGDNDEQNSNLLLEPTLSMNSIHMFDSSNLIKDYSDEPFLFDNNNNNIEEHSEYIINGLPENIQKDENINNVKNDNNTGKETNDKTDPKVRCIEKVQNKINNNDKNEENNLFKVKSSRKTEPRLDYVIKDIKVYISKYLKDYGNELIKKCNFKNRLDKAKLFSPSYKYFTGNSNFKDNVKFLELLVEEIFTYPDKEVKKDDNRLQRQNKDIIKDIKDHIEEKYGDDIPEEYIKLLNFFRMSFEDAIMQFYESEYFTKYTSSEKARRNEYFYKTKGYSILEKNAFIKLIKDYAN